jgi:hypothetical protein
MALCGLDVVDEIERLGALRQGARNDQRDLRVRGALIVMQLSMRAVIPIIRSHFCQNA